MFSKSSASSAIIVLISTSSVQGQYKDYGCVQCIESGNVWMYAARTLYRPPGPGGPPPVTYSSYTYGDSNGDTKVCCDPQGINCSYGFDPKLNVPKSSDIPDPFLRRHACSSHPGNCDRRYILLDAQQPTIDVTISTKKITKEFSCSYDVIASCGLPVVTLKKIPEKVPGADFVLEYAEMALDNTDLLKKQSALLGKAKMGERPHPFSIYLPDLSQKFTALVDQSASIEGTLSTIDGKVSSDVAKEIQTWKDSYNTYLKKLESYYDSQEKYTRSYIDMLTENFADFIKKGRKEGAELFKSALTATPSLPTEPAAYAGSYLTPTAWDTMSGKPASGTILFAGKQGQKKSFGVKGQGTGLDKGFDDNHKSVLWHYEKFKNSADAMGYGDSICRKKLLMLNFYQKHDSKFDDSTIKYFDDDIELTFTTEQSQFIDVLQPTVESMYAKAELTKNSWKYNSIIAEMGTFYEQNSASSLMSSAAISAAALVTLCLY